MDNVAFTPSFYFWFSNRVSLILLFLTEVCLILSVSLLMLSESPFRNSQISTVTAEKDQLLLQWHPPGSSPIMEAGSLRSLNAYLIKNATGNCGIRHSWRDEFSCLSVYLVFTRDKSFYFSTVFVPGMVLVTSSFISFWLDVNAVPARVMIGVTTMLNFCTTTNRYLISPTSISLHLMSQDFEITHN